MYDFSTVQAAFRKYKYLVGSVRASKVIRRRSDVIFCENNTDLYWKEIFFMYGLMDTGSPTL